VCEPIHSNFKVTASSLVLCDAEGKIIDPNAAIGMPMYS
jgi:hypothetical protein